MNTLLAGITNTPLDNIITPLLGTAGIVLVIWAVIKSVKDFSTGAVSKGVQRIVIMAAVAALLLNPNLIGTLISGISKLVEAVVNNLGDFFDGNSGGNTPAPPTGN
jgi:hypothetical protein